MTVLRMRQRCCRIAPFLDRNRLFNVLFGAFLYAGLCVSIQVSSGRNDTGAYAT